MRKFFVKKFFSNMRIPSQSVRIPKKGEEEIPSKPVDQITYNNKYNLNPENIDDYILIGAEIFKNAYKEAMIMDSKNLQQVPEEEYFAEGTYPEEVYHPKEEPFEYKKPGKYLKHFERRIFYDQADPRYKHMFVPSYRYKVEAFNSRYTFKFGISNALNRDEHNEVISKKNSFVKGFNTTKFDINDQNLDILFNKLKELKIKYNVLDLNNPEFQKIITDEYNNPENSEIEYVREYVKIIEDFLNIIPKINHKLLPIIPMKAFFELGLNDKRLWILLEQEILNNLHHLNITEICQIFYICTISSPKYSSKHFKSMLYQVIHKEVFSMTLKLEDLFTISFAFRNSKDKALYDKIAENFKKRKQ
jgi:hypothetical protein